MQAQDVRKVDNAIQRINHYPVDPQFVLLTRIHWTVIIRRIALSSL